MEDYNTIFQRPHFLTIFKNFNVSIWTAAIKSYMLFIEDKNMTKAHPERRFYFCHI
jgi:hypothetical protein